VRQQIAKYIDLWLSQCQKPSASGYGSHSPLPDNFWILIPFGSFSTDAGSGNHELLTHSERVNGEICRSLSSLARRTTCAATATRSYGCRIADRWWIALSVTGKQLPSPAQNIAI
jgi:hypothetical protein